jgi:hypothetical protein
VPKEDDSWARAPVSETGSLVSAEVRRRTTIGGGALLTRQIGLLLLAEVKRRITAGGGVLGTPHVVVHLLCTRRLMPKEHDSWARAPVPETGSPWRASGEVFCGTSGRQWGNPSLKRDSPKHGSHSH